MGQVVSAVSRSDQLSEINQQLQTALDQQAVLQRELMRLASTDELTGAVNRRQIVNDGILEMERYRHTGSPFSVTVIDVDHFKSINDTFGHATGDEVLRRLTKCCQALLRRFDVLGRLGGEEFCIIHHDTDMYGAQMAAQRILSAIEMMFMSDILPDRKFSISMGVAEVHECDTSFYDVLHMADAALYEAKRSGRNTYRIASSRTLEAA
jgi:diguanylate cyclase (GGDEF)-like protein